MKDNGKDQEIIALQFEIARLKKEGIDLLVYRDEEIATLSARVSELEKQVDGMKCSGNCAHESDGHEPCNGKWRYSNSCPCTYWTLRASRPKEG